jgi:hypothetical protein
VIAHSRAVSAQWGGETVAADGDCGCWPMCGMRWRHGTTRDVAVVAREKGGRLDEREEEVGSSNRK